MSFIRAIVPMKDYRLFMEMESGSSVIVDLSESRIPSNTASLKTKGCLWK